MSGALGALVARGRSIQLPPNGTYNANTTGGGTATFRFRFNSVGDVDTTSESTSNGNATVDRKPAWAGYYQDQPASVGSPYEIRLTVTSGTSPNEVGSDTTGSWLALSSNRQWGLTRTGTGTTQGTYTIEIRAAASGTVMASGSFTFQCVVNA